MIHHTTRRVVKVVQGFQRALPYIFTLCMSFFVARPYAHFQKAHATTTASGNCLLRNTYRKMRHTAAVHYSLYPLLRYVFNNSHYVQLFYIINRSSSSSSSSSPVRAKNGSTYMQWSLKKKTQLFIFQSQYYF